MSYITYRLPRAVEELRELFAECTRRKDYSRIPADLTKVTYITVRLKTTDPLDPSHSNLGGSARGKAGIRSCETDLEEAQDSDFWHLCHVCNSCCLEDCARTHCPFRHAMCAVEDPILIQETLEFLLIDARDQDVIYFFEGLQANHKTRRTLLQFFRENYDLVSAEQ